MKIIPMFVVSSFSTLVFAAPAYAASETREFDSQSIRQIDVDNQSGRIHIRGGAGAKTTVTVDKVKFGNSCKIEMKHKGDELSIEIEHRGPGRTEECEANLELQVPTQVKLDVTNGSGNISVEGTQGEIDFEVGSGNVSLDGRIDDLEGKSGSGSVEAKGLTGSAELKNGAGDLRLTYTAIPTHGELEIRSGSGNAEVFLPAKTKLKVQAFSGAGSVRNEFTNDSTAPFRISFKSGTGHLRLRKI